MIGLVQTKSGDTTPTTLEQIYEFPVETSDVSASLQVTVKAHDVNPSLKLSSRHSEEAIVQAASKESRKSVPGSIAGSRVSYTSSQKSVQARIRRAKADLERKQLLRRQELERQQQEIQMQIQLAELERKRDLRQLEDEIEQAEMDEIIYYDADSNLGLESILGSERRNQQDETNAYHFLHISRENPARQAIISSAPLLQPPLPLGSEKLVPPPVKQAIVGNPISALNPEARAWVTPEVTQASSASFNTVELHQILSQQQQQQRETLQYQRETMLLMASTIRRGFELPRPELFTFDGNPLTYHKFTQNFEANLAREATNDRMRLVYLIQQCTGDAKKAIEFCVNIDPPEQGYARAREILLKRYD